MKLPADSPSSFIACVFSLLGKLAAADGRVTKDETRKVERYIDEELKLDPKLRILALEVFQEAFDSPLEVRDYVEKFSHVFRDKVQLPEQVVELMLCVSMADGELNDSEAQLVRSAALLMGLSPPAFERVKEKVIRKSEGLSDDDDE